MGSAAWDVVVIGGGHAGTEAAAASARMGARTLLLTHSVNTIGAMSCNPSIGGIGKGHLVREIDALDGVMGRAADRSGIHFKVLNRSKGPAVRGLRAQADRKLYARAVRDILNETQNLTIEAASVEDVKLDSSGKVAGVVTGGGLHVSCGAVVLTAGTFLRGAVHIGAERWPAGRMREAPAMGLAQTLAKLKLPLGRMKTGTPPRLLRSSIDWDSLLADEGDAELEFFSLLTKDTLVRQVDCRITATTEETHRLVRTNLAHSAAYGGQIFGKGPRYCPSIEDKVVRFPDRERHQIFLEPEGLDDETIYPNGLSTSLPLPLQEKLVASIPGLERAKITQPGYAVEYDYVDPRSLRSSLQVRAVGRLFLAGQVNGTTGYEEAAAQGILAGINAARLAGSGEPVELDRGTGYLGVLVDDLTSQGVTEPYRMFTSRAEYRLELRCDNADERLTPLGMKWGCVGLERRSSYLQYAADLNGARLRARSEKLADLPGAISVGLPAARDRACSLYDRFWQLPRHTGSWVDSLQPRVRTQLAAESLYSGFSERQRREIRELQAAKALRLPAELKYECVPGLSAEIRAVLETAQPETLFALEKLPGMTPTAAASILGHLRGRATV